MGSTLYTLYFLRSYAPSVLLQTTHLATLDGRSLLAFGPGRCMKLNHDDVFKPITRVSRLRAGRARGPQEWYHGGVVCSINEWEI